MLKCLSFPFFLWCITDFIGCGAPTQTEPVLRSPLRSSAPPNAPRALTDRVKCVCRPSGIWSGRRGAEGRGYGPRLLCRARVAIKEAFHNLWRRNGDAIAWRTRSSRSNGRIELRVLMAAVARFSVCGIWARWCLVKWHRDLEAEEVEKERRRWTEPRRYCRTGTFWPRVNTTEQARAHSQPRIETSVTERGRDARP